jgi:hypothetical protein
MGAARVRVSSRTLAQPIATGSRLALAGMNADRAEEWIPVAEALAVVDLFEAERRTILGIDLARITSAEKLLLPACADFSRCTTAEESWAFARRLLADELPTDATHATFVG